MPDYKTLFSILYKANHKAIQILTQAQKEMEDTALDDADPIAMLLAMGMEDELAKRCSDVVPGAPDITQALQAMEREREQYEFGKHTEATD